MPLTVRRAAPADAPVIADFNARLAFETEGKTLDAAVLARGVRAVFEDAAKGFYTVAARPDGTVVGQMMVTFEWSDWRNGWFWWVQSVYVREDARREGVFKALFNHTRAAAEADATVIGLRLYFERHNQRARATYRALGMNDADYGMMEIYPLAGRSNDIR
jgi:GNAT superfamily N-acetyltransferase